ncbi:hypothetical protein AZE42_11156 [Rhizopogon vesiculosus]|uniref:Uncharacterized protein n=1 Tax=Rhizopogon vesiculosus TaxID=180088 RepID=A0A1J8QBM4_9AGAM|nr:hypothetical protein AZE42_11156 [Rhizopogon vesiculosus]
MYYTFSPTVSPRVFTVLRTIHLDESSPRTGMVVSIPIDFSGLSDEELANLEEKSTKGRTPGGSIPSFIAESSIAGQISADVPRFLKWFHTVRSEVT